MIDRISSINYQVEKQIGFFFSPIITSKYVRFTKQLLQLKAQRFDAQHQRTDTKNPFQTIKHFQQQSLITPLILGYTTEGQN